MPTQENDPTQHPLTREHVKRLIAQAGGDPGKVDLSFQNLSGANLSELDLRNINLNGANLAETDLLGTNLSGANLSGANLAGTDLRGAKLLGANLSPADLTGTDLLSPYILSTPPSIVASIKTLSNLPSQVWVQRKLTNLAKAYGSIYTCEVMQQWRAQQSASNEITSVSAKIPSEIEVNRTDAEIPQERNEELSTDSMPVPVQTLLRFRIEQEPLRSHNLSRVLRNLTRIHTKAFLISQGRYADLINCIQDPLDSKFQEEANIDFITSPPHSLTSRTEFEGVAAPKFNVNTKAKAAISPTKLAEAFRAGVEIMVNNSKTLAIEFQELKFAESDLKVKEEQKAQAYRADQDQKRSVKAQEAELHEKKFALREQIFNKATEAAERLVTMLQPNVDYATKAMLIQSVLSHFNQLGETVGLVLLLLLLSEPENKGID